jgi:methylated-DNA-[protein]-cysteine S-methyltransferase
MKKQTFNERCYSLLKKVPKGKVTTYKALALKLNTKAYRAVGNAMNKNPNAPKVPCHRVVGHSGDLTGFATGIKNAKIRRRPSKKQQSKLTDLRT